MPEIITTISVSAAIATIISLFSILLQELRWRRSNRPIVSAYICDAEKGREIGKVDSFNLVLVNSGAMPAINVCLRAKESDLNKIFSGDTEESEKQVVKICFDEESSVSLLLNGEKVETYFGTSEHIGNGKCRGLEYDAWLPIKITYYDLNKHKYDTEIKLKIRDSYGFGGAVLGKTRR